MSVPAYDVVLPSRQKENTHLSVKDHTKRFIGSNTIRIPLSPSKQCTPSNAIDDLAADLKNLSVVRSESQRKVYPFSSTPTALPTSLRSRSESSDSSYKFAPTEHKSRTYKPIDDYRSPVQLLTRDPDWAALAPQAQHGMLGIGNMPLKLTNVIRNDWLGLEAEVSEATLSQARVISSKNNDPFPKQKVPDVEGEEAKTTMNHGEVSTVFCSHCSVVHEVVSQRMTASYMSAARMGHSLGILWLTLQWILHPNMLRMKTD